MSRLEPKAWLNESSEQCLTDSEKGLEQLSAHQVGRTSYADSYDVALYTLTHEQLALLEGAQPAAEPAPKWSNLGHGHVNLRPDGVKARCGGPAMCRECQREAARVKAWAEPTQAADVLSRPEVPYYIGGPYADGTYAMCELATARVVAMHRPGNPPLPVLAEHVAQPEAERDAELAMFYATTDEYHTRCGHKAAMFEVWLLARGLMTIDGRRTAALAAPAQPEAQGLPHLPKTAKFLTEPFELAYRTDQMLAYGDTRAAAERERCANVAENYDLGTPEGHAIAAAIRSATQEGKS